MGIDERAWTDAARAALAGGREALSALASLVWPSVRRWSLLELSDPSLADDASQEALVRMIRHIHGWDPDRPFAPWLHTLVRNAARDTRARRGDVREPAREEERGIEPSHDLRLDLRRTASLALAAFARCSPRQRAALDLCDLQGHTPAEAAEILGVAPGTLRALLHQGRRVVRDAVMSETGGEGEALLRGASRGL